MGDASRHHAHLGPRGVAVVEAAAATAAAAPSGSQARRGGQQLRTAPFLKAPQRRRQRLRSAHAQARLLRHALRQAQPCPRVGKQIP